MGKDGRSLGGASADAEQALVNEADKSSSPFGFDPSRIMSLNQPRHSPNLRKWATRHLSKYHHAHFAVDKRESLHIGHMFEDGWFHGAQVMRCCTAGAKAETYAYQPDHMSVVEFFPQYARLGRCAIDPKHSGWWAGDRWEEAGDVRTCLWCGERQRRETYTFTEQRERWVALGMEAREGQDRDGLGSRQPDREAGMPDNASEDSHD